MKSKNHFCLIRLHALPFLLFALILLTGCGQAAPEAAYDFAESKAAFSQQSSEDEAGVSGDGASAAVAAIEGNGVPGAAGKTRKLVKEARIGIRVENLEEAQKKTGELMARYGAYSALMRSFGNSVQYEIRVPSASYDAFLGGVTAIGKMLDRSESSEDVTVKYYDLEGRLATKKALLTTFQSHLLRAQSIDDIMKIENRIADLQNEIDWLGSQLSELSGLVDFSTVHLNLEGPVSADPSYRPGIGERILDIFLSFGDFASAALVAVTAILLFGAPVLLLILLAFWLFFGRVGLLKKAFRLAGVSSKAAEQTPAEKTGEEK
ncbi:MAG: DUF4349 domain-containing protein [Treponema sp.]|jgi:hypothetical protein|nr:DUF4349 domain-containing protein [Treponema sp.]